MKILDPPLPVSRSTVNRQLQEMRRAPNMATPQDDDDEEIDIDDFRAEFAEVRNIVTKSLDQVRYFSCVSKIKIISFLRV